MYIHNYVCMHFIHIFGYHICRYGINSTKVLVEIFDELAIESNLPIICTYVPYNQLFSQEVV